MPTSHKASSLQHPLGKDNSIPKMLSPERLAYLTGRLRSGEIVHDEREELARGFIRLALKIAASYAARRPQKGDDFASAALFGIAYAIETAREKLEDDNITGWIIANIRRFLRQFYERDHIVRTPARTYHHKKTHGVEMVTTSVITMDDREINAGANNRKASTYHRIRNVSGGYSDLREILDKSARDEVDRDILKLRSQGYNDVEISSMTGISKSTINARRAEMETRFDRLNQE